MSPSHPLVSVIIPYYARPALVQRAIDSVVAQTYRPIEVVIVDDASPAPLVLSDSGSDGDVQVRIVRHDENAGPSAARNSGIAAAEGSIIAFLDSDDEWLPQKIERQVAEIQASADPENAVAIARTVMRMPSGIVPQPLWDKSRESLSSFLFVHGGTLQTSSFLLSKRLAAAVGFDPALRQFEDMLFLLKLDAIGATFVQQGDTLVYWNRDDRADRLSRSVSLADAWRFLDAAGSTMEPRARLAFEVRIMGATLVWQDPMHVCRASFTAWRQKLVTPRNLAGLTKKAWKSRPKQSGLFQRQR